MVGLNGSALPDQDFNPTELNGSHALKEERDLKQRRARSSQSFRGPKPLLPRSLKEALQLAELLSKSKLIPKGFETPETCLVGILYGMEVGLSPIAALQRMAVIDGRPTIWGDAALALVQASGLLQSIQEEIIEKDDIENRKILTAICIVRREGRSEPVTGTFSIEDAKRAGLWQKPGPWTDYPKRMLIMRARAFALRDTFPDVLAGLYIREEFEGSSRRQARASEEPSRSDEADWNAIGAERSPSSSVSRRAPPPPPESSNQADGPTTEPELQSDHFGYVAEQHNLAETAADEQNYSKAEEPLDPETILDLLDCALCCALDIPTLEEIVDDFAQRLKGLSKDHQKQAQKIIDRHHRRVEDLDQADLSSKDNQTEINELPRGLKSLMPSLGLGHLPMMLPLRRYRSQPNRSFASWNARHRLPQLNFKHGDEEDPKSDHLETGE